MIIKTLIFDGAPAAGQRRVEPMLAGFDANAVELDGPPIEPMTMIYTSGTTGKPKGAVRSTLGNPQQSAALWAEIGYVESDVYITTGPLYHSGPSGFLATAHRQGQTAVLQHKFDEEDWLRLVETYRGPLLKGDTTFVDVLRGESLVLAADLMVPFAHWITPEVVPKRFDTHFFLIAAPMAQLGAHDGGESVEGFWITPQQALRDYERALYQDRFQPELAARVAAEADRSFAVVHQECAATSYSLAHEIGHLVGARHDLALDDSMDPYPHGHGFVNGTKWRTMMSYKDSCGGCPRLPVWSNPDIKIDGVSAGDAKADNARVLRDRASVVSTFR